jgi:hypothetical protein
MAVSLSFAPISFLNYLVSLKQTKTGASYWNVRNGLDVEHLLVEAPDSPPQVLVRQAADEGARGGLCVLVPSQVLPLDVPMVKLRVAFLVLLCTGQHVAVGRWVLCWGDGHYEPPILDRGIACLSAGWRRSLDCGHDDDDSVFQGCFGKEGKEGLLGYKAFSK